MTVRVLVVDDSPTVCEILVRELTRDREIDVVGVAHDAFDARDQIVRLSPDVLTLDIEMPRMDGITFLRKLMEHHPIPVVVVSSLTEHGGRLAMDALEAGGVEVVCKPRSADGVRAVTDEICATVKAAASARLSGGPGDTVGRRGDSQEHFTAARRRRRIVAIGASTGGPRALQQVLPDLPEDGPATLVVQHMPAEFSRSFAARLDDRCAMAVREAEDGDRLERGTVLLAAGGLHLFVEPRGASERVRPEDLVVRVKSGPPVNRHRPSVDVLFNSLARHVASCTFGVVLTGMGHDGARGLKELRDGGATTVAQSERTSVIFGMPRRAIELGAASHVLDVEQISERIVDECGSVGATEEPDVTLERTVTES